MARQPSFLIEIEPALVGLHQLERRAIDKNDLGPIITAVLHRPGDLFSAVAVNEDKLLAETGGG